MESRQHELLRYLHQKMEAKNFWINFRDVHRLEKKLALLDSEIEWAKIELFKLKLETRDD